MKKAVAGYPPFEFTWSFPKEGFEWGAATRLDGTRGVFLIERHVPPFVRREYTPFRFEAFSGLFREFAGIPPTKEGVLGFANKYGRLGKPLSISVWPDKYRRKTGKVSISELPFDEGETLAMWKQEITAMKALAEAWDAIRVGDVETLGKWLRWKKTPEGGNGVFFEWPFGGGWLAMPGDDAMERFKPPGAPQPADLLPFARYWLQRELNQALERHPSTPRLLWPWPGEELRLYIHPASLISALWLQFAYAVAENWTYRTCKQCGLWFQVGPRADLRSDAQFHNNACKQKYWREEQKRREEQKKRRAEK